MLGINTVGDRYSLGKGSVDCLSHLGGHIPFIGEFNRANLFTLAAPGTIVFDMTRLAAHLYFEVADKAADVFHLTVGEQLDVGFLADRNHLGRADAGRTVKRGKGFVILQHVPADRRLPLDQVGLESGLGNIK